MKVKKFKDLRPGDKIYILDPADSSIKETTITKIGSFPQKDRKHLIAIKCYKVKSNIFSKEALDIAETLHDTDLYNTIITLKEVDKSLIVYNDMPTMIFTDRQKLQEWITLKNR